MTSVIAHLGTNCGHHSRTRLRDSIRVRLGVHHFSMSRFIGDPFFFMLAICLCNYSLPLPSSYAQVRNHCITLSLWNIILDQGLDARAPFLRSTKNWESNRSSYEDVSRLTNRRRSHCWFINIYPAFRTPSRRTTKKRNTATKQSLGGSRIACPPDIHWCITSGTNSARNDTHLCSLSPWYPFDQSLEHTQ